MALAAAGVVGTGYVTPANACTASRTLVGGVPVSVRVDCVAGDQADNFLTSYDTGSDSYDGAGADVLNLVGGQVGDGFGAPPPTFDGPTGPFLDESDFVIETLGGDDSVTLGSSAASPGGATLTGGIMMGGGNDVFVMSAGSIAGSVLGDDALTEGDDQFTVSGGSIAGSIFAGGGNDNVSITGGSIGVAAGGPDSVGLESGDDVFTMSGGTLAGSVSGGSGDDQITITGGSIGGFVAGNDGVDVVTVRGGTIAGGISAETVNLLGGSIGGDITGISGDTLTINATSLTLRNGVLFQGTNAVGSNTATNLAGGGSQNFSGFSAFTMQNGASMRFSGGAQEIAGLLVDSGSTLFSTGAGSLTRPGGGLGNLTVTNATLNMVNGATGDVFNVGNLALNGATLALDVNGATGLADLISTAGALTATGANTVFVNLIGPLQLSSPSVVAIAPVAGEAAPANGIASPLFTVAGIPATPGALFTYTAINGPSGGLYLLAVPTEVAAPTATRTALDASPIDNVTGVVYDILNDSILSNFGLLPSAARPDAAPNFGIYASGQYARVDHDGFQVSSPLVSGLGPSFTADDFSIAASVEFNAAKYFGFDQTYGLDLGMFGGYASTDVSMDPTALFPDIGDGENRSGMVGGYGLFRSGTTYGLVSATGFFGNTDINNAVLASTGTYDTAGVAVTGTAGHVFALGDTWRFDLRGGVLGVYFEGDAFTDSMGNNFGKSRISFGAVKFEPGVFATYQLEGGKIFSPYLRSEFQQRFSYKNTSSVEGTEFNFDDADFSASVSAGANYKFTEVWTASAEVRGKFSADSQTLAGKVGLKARF
ncbi:MAG: hypothetical protein KF914_21005 [Rhizobiaceae bacterium]|nr:hypothetical protein [Rhizobiaceae bacterium]